MHFSSFKEFLSKRLGYEEKGIDNEDSYEKKLLHLMIIALHLFLTIEMFLEAFGADTKTKSYKGKIADEDLLKRVGANHPCIRRTASIIDNFLN